MPLSVTVCPTGLRDAERSSDSSGTTVSCSGLEVVASRLVSPAYCTRTRCDSRAPTATVKLPSSPVVACQALRHPDVP